MQRPRFRSHLRVHVVPPDLLLLEDESDHAAFEGAVFALLAPLIDGVHSGTEIADTLEGHAKLLDVHFGLSLLEEHGYLVEAGDARSPEQRAFGDLLGLDPERQLQDLAANRVHVRACGEVSAAPLVKLLEELHLRLAPEAEFEVVVTEDYLNEELEEINRHALESGRPWMPVKPVGERLWVGPVFRPGKTACWACLGRRLRQNHPLSSFVAAHGGHEVVRPFSRGTGLPSMAQAALGLAATEVLRCVRRGAGQLEDRLLELDLISMRTTTHPVARLLDCPACGDPSAVPSPGAPVVLESRPKLFLTDGGHRTVLPEDTIEKYRHHISPLTGIVDEVRPVHRDDFTQLHVTSYGFPAMLEDRSFLKKGLRARSTGKGMHAAQARTSAFCEAMERYSGVFRGDEPRRRANYAQLGEEAVHPNRCMLVSPAQYAGREAWNKEESQFNWIPEPFDDKREIEWTACWSLTDDEVRFLPSAYCYYGYPGERDVFSRADSNGNAAGNTLEEAILQGFMELVERDCVALWWYNRIQRPGVDLASMGQPYFTALGDYYRSLGRSLAVLDITADLEIPAFAAISQGPGKGEVEDLVIGFGAHFDPVVGVSRALTEMNQFLPAARRGRPLRISSRVVMGQAFLEPAEDLRPRKLDDFRSTWSDDLKTDVESCVGIAGLHGMEVLILDQTRADVGLPVVKVVVPGLRPFWARFAAGRLYDVPPALGWTGGQLPEDRLNPAHLMI